VQIRAGLDHRSRLQLLLEYASVISAIVEKRKALSPQRALLVGISGIASLDFVGIFLNPKSPLTHLNEKPRFL
jgi:hypothetical protein